MQSVKYALLAAAVAGLTGIAVPASAEVALKFGWATTDSATDSYNFTAHAFADALQAAKPNYFKVSFFPNRQLGDERDMLQGLQLGTVDTALITNSVIANVDPAFTINDLPFLYPSSDAAFKVLDGKPGQGLLDRLKKRRVVGLAWCDSGFRNMVNRVRPINSVEDVKGLKVRVIESPLFVRMFQLLDAAGVPMPFGEVFSALQQGTIDGMENPTWSIASSRFDEVTKYLSITRHIYSAIPILMSAKLYDSMSGEDQKIVTQAAATACAKQRTFNSEAEAKIIDGMKAKGIKVNEVKDMDAFRKKMDPLFAEYRTKIGPDVFDGWIDSVAKAK